MAGWRRAVELAMTAEEIETLTAPTFTPGLCRPQSKRQSWLALFIWCR